MPRQVKVKASNSALLLVDCLEGLLSYDHPYALVIPGRKKRTVAEQLERVDEEKGEFIRARKKFGLETQLHELVDYILVSSGTLLRVWAKENKISEDQLSIMIVREAIRVDKKLVERWFYGGKRKE